MSATSSRWTVRAFVLCAFAAAVWFGGPRTAEVLAAKFGDGKQPGPMVALDRVGFVEKPAWMSDDMLVGVAASLSPWLSGEVGILDEATGLRLRDGLVSTPWVESARMERVFPDRFRIHIELRRPSLSVHAGDDTPLCLVDDQGVMLPWSPNRLPVVRLYREGGSPTMAVSFGERARERRVTVAAMVAAEWRAQVVPLVKSCPDLLEVEVSNLGERWIVGMQYPEIRVVLARADREPVSFAYGRPPDSPLPRVPARTKALVLDNILRAHAGLDGLIAGDLRLARRWKDYLQPRDPKLPDPHAPWTQLDLELPPKRGGD
ncbi:MAG: hypothetical protein VYD05_11150 [Planctomycetota bacterium]|nr:hypothetical protein [Planctomycetota bacterium]MEC8253188.1 hypothetical protein [Planctomycetota bacterium]MEC8651518.1 hypothetical protein [Planctomycetota bacterium]